VKSNPFKSKTPTPSRNKSHTISTETNQTVNDFRSKLRKTTNNIPSSILPEIVESKTETKQPETIVETTNQTTTIETNNPTIETNNPTNETNNSTTVETNNPPLPEVEPSTPLRKVNLRKTVQPIKQQEVLEKVEEAPITDFRSKLRKTTNNIPSSILPINEEPKKDETTTQKPPFRLPSRVKKEDDKNTTKTEEPPITDFRSRLRKTTNNI